MFALLTLFAFFLGNTIVGTEAAGQTMAFMVLSMSQIIQAFNMRSSRSLFAIGPFSNKKLNLAALGSLGLTVAILFTPLRIPFGIELLPVGLYLIALGLILVPFAVMEISKLFKIVKH